MRAVRWVEQGLEAFMTDRFLRIELHELGPRAWLLGRRLHEWEVGAALVAAILAAWTFDIWDPTPAGELVAALGLWMLIKDWRDVFPRTRDTARWRIGVHRRVRALRAVRRADWLPGVLAVGTAATGIVNVASALTRNPHWRTHV